MNILSTSLALTIIVVIVIAFVVWDSCKNAIEEQKEKNLELSAKIAELEAALVKEQKHSFRKGRILEELLIISQIGYNPTEVEKSRMMGMLIEDKKFVNKMSSKIYSYRTDRAKEIAGHLNEVGKELIDIYEALTFSLSESITGDRSLYQEFVDYFANYGFQFCGKTLRPESEED